MKTKLHYLSIVLAFIAGIHQATVQAQNLFESDFYGNKIYEFTTNGTPGIFASGLAHPTGLAFNSAGILFALDAGSGNIYEFTTNGTQSTFASGLNSPQGLAFDTNGNLFVSDAGSGNIYEFTNGMAAEKGTFASGLHFPFALAFNSAGNLFVADGSTVYEYTPLGARSTLDSLLNQPIGLAFDSAGDLFVADAGDNGAGQGNIYEFTNNAGSLSPNPVTFASGLDYSDDLAFDSAGNLFESDGNSGNIFEFTTNGTQSTFASGLSHPSGLAFSANFSVTITNSTPPVPFTYTTNYINGTIIITGYTGVNAGSVTIPDTINGLPVTSIGYEAFYYNEALTNITIGVNVTSIGSLAFGFCDSLTNITVDAANPNYSSLNGVLFDKAQATLIQFPAGQGGGYIIPNAVTAIGDDAFNGCSSLTSLTIDTNATSIGYESFGFCDHLITLTIPASVTNISDYAFGADPFLGAVYFEGNAPPDDGTVFHDDSIDTIVYYLYGTTGWGSTFGGVPAFLLNPPAQGPFTDPTNFTYSVNSGFVTITGYIGTNTAVSIPETINGMAVTSIGGGAFAGTTLTNITIPSSVRSIGGDAFLESDLISVSIGTNVTSIGAEAFSSCRSLVGVTIPDSVTNLGDYAFSYCPNLTSVTLGANLTSMQSAPFAFCTGLTNITVNPANAAYCSINGVLFDKAQTTLLQFPVGLGGSYAIPASVTTIGEYAFGECFGLTNITIPSGVTNIGEDAFTFCQSLTSVSLPDSLGFIGIDAFAYCFGLTNITIPASVTTLGDLSFQGCYDLTSVYFLGNAPPEDETAIFRAFSDDSGAMVHYLYGTTGWGVAYGGIPAQARIAPGFGYAASGGTIIITGYTGPDSAVVIPDTLFGLPVTGIAARAFANVSYVTSVNITTNVTNLGDGAFTGTGLKSVSLSSNVTTIGNEVFENCTSLTNITVAAANPSYCSAGRILFDKTQLNLIQFPTGLSGNYIIPDGVTNIGAYSFAYSGITAVTIPATVTGIGANAFYGCAGLTNVFIPASVTSIGDEAFADCTTLTNIAVDVSNLDYSSANGALLDKGQTTLIQFPAGLTSLATFTGVTSVGASALAGCVNLTTLVIPDGIQIIGDPVFYDCTNLTTVSIPASVITIGLDAFANCTKLTNITVDAANQNYSSLNGVLFDKAQATLIQFPAGQGGGYTIPNTVTAIGDDAFNGCSSLTSVSVGSNVASIGIAAFAYCTSLTNIAVSASNPNYSSSGGVLFDKLQKTLIGFPAGLAGTYNIPIGVTNIADEAFAGCNLTSVTIDANALGIGDESFADCTGLDAVYFLGNAPAIDLGTAFAGDNNSAAVYFLPGATGWNSGSFGGAPTALWNPQKQAPGMIAGNFGFGITGPANAVIVIEACTNLVNPVWLPVGTNVLDEIGNSTFTDSQWKNYAGRYYRFHAP